MFSQSKNIYDIALSNLSDNDIKLYKYILEDAQEKQAFMLMLDTNHFEDVDFSSFETSLNNLHNAGLIKASKIGYAFVIFVKSDNPNSIYLSYDYKFLDTVEDWSE